MARVACFPRAAPQGGSTLGFIMFALSGREGFFAALTRGVALGYLVIALSGRAIPEPIFAFRIIIQNRVSSCQVKNEKDFKKRTEPPKERFEV